MSTEQLAREVEILEGWIRAFIAAKSSTNTVEEWRHAAQNMLDGLLSQRK